MKLEVTIYHCQQYAAEIDVDEAIYRAFPTSKARDDYLTELVLLKCDADEGDEWDLLEGGVSDIVEVRA